MKVIAVELKELLNIFYKKLWLIISLPLIAAIIVAFFSLCILSPVYESGSTLYIINKSTNESNISYNEILTNQMFVKDYRELIKSRSVTKEVIEELKINDLTPDELAEKIKVATKSETRVLDIRVQDSDPQRAKLLAETVSKIFIKKSIDLMNVDNVNIVDNPEIPEEPVYPKPLKYCIYVFLVGIVVALGIAYLSEYVNDKIVSTEDVENHMGLTVIGIIPLLKVK